MSNKIKTHGGIVIFMIILAAASRLFPHPPNFTPVGAMALFGATYFAKRWMAFVVPIVAIWLSSLVLDNIFLSQYYDGFVWFSHPFVYLAFALIVVLGWTMIKKVKPGNLILASLGASVIFFIVSNFGHWIAFHPNKTFTGLLECYALGLPFLRWTILGDLVYVAVLFGGFEYVKRRYLNPSTELQVNS